MGMTIEDSERYLRLMLGGMKHAVSYWKDKDKEESDIEQTNVEAVKTALDTMRKYQQIKNIICKWEVGIYDDEGLCHTEVLEMISNEVNGDGNDD